MRHVRRQQHGKPRRSKFDNGNGIDFVRCRICGRHLCVISGRDLSTHGTDRETYIEEYRLSPDQLCSKTFRVNHSSRSDFCAHSRREWIAAMKAVYRKHGNVYPGFLQKHHPNLYLEGIWLNGGDWDAALRVLGFTPERMRLLLITRHSEEQCVSMINLIKASIKLNSCLTHRTPNPTEAERTVPRLSYTES
jgi:hypothetical protein